MLPVAGRQFFCLYKSVSLSQLIHASLINVCNKRTYYLSSQCYGMRHGFNKKKVKKRFSETSSILVDQILNQSHSLGEERVKENGKHSEEFDNKLSDEELDDLRYDIKSSISHLKTGGPLRTDSKDLPPVYSSVPCVGCGALLHCVDPKSPGFVLPRRFHSVEEDELEETDLLCQRCVTINTHNIALDVSVTPQEYIDVIGQARDIQGLIVIVVDMLDMPNSLYSILPSIIGEKRPVYVVGNKVDLLPLRNLDDLDSVLNSLEEACFDCGLADKVLIKHACLISARTGYGIESLVTKLFLHWGRKGQVLLMGCTNAGKSTLFNALLSSDYCKSVARDFYHRATVSQWPGTTLNLLKFPIFKATMTDLSRRFESLKKSHTHESDPTFMLQNYVPGKTSRPVLKGSIGQTYLNATLETVDKKTESGSAFISPSYSFSHEFDEAVEVGMGKKQVRKAIKEDTKEDFKERLDLEKHLRWCYDTPGVVNPEQIINLLTQSELSKVISTVIIKPRTFIMKPGQVMFVSGMGRIDYIQGPKSIYFTLFASQKIPVHVKGYHDADVFYRENIGSSVLAVPHGEDERVAAVPSLVGREMRITGITWTQSAADVVLSSIGWVAVTPGPGMDVKVRAYTPALRGCVLRQPSMLSYSVNYRGSRIRSSPAYRQPNYKGKKLKENK